MLLVAAIAVLVLAVWAYTKRRRDPPDPLDGLPGPPNISLIAGMIYSGQMTLKNRFLMNRVMHKLYGTRFVVKLLGLRLLNVMNPEDIEAILSHSRNISKGSEYRFIFALFGDGLITSKGAKWFQRRRMLSPAFHFAILHRFAPLMAERAHALVDLIPALTQTGTELEVYPVISQTTFHMICETAMGTKLDEHKHAVSKMVKIVKEIHEISVMRMLRIYLRPDFIFNRVALSKKLEKGQLDFDSFVHNLIAERREITYDTPEDEPESKKRLAMLDLLLEAESKGLMDLEGVHEEVKTFIIAGYGTVSLAVTYGIMLLADHEDVQARIYEECQRIFGESSRSASMSDLAEMKYLEAVIKEVLRLYPSVPSILREVTEDFMMGDLQVQKGVQVAVQIYDLHHREDLYPDPEAFKPERFLDGVQRHPFAYIPFSAGPRNCIGQRFAMLEMKCILSEIVRHFELAPRSKGWRPPLYSALLMHPCEPIHVKFLSRK